MVCFGTGAVRLLVALVERLEKLGRRGPEDDSEKVETFSPKITFYVTKLLCF